ncbi:unnamed protein product [Protopolystoma xenopodis]|uniref:MATH domain-containing protein n=1 Tax=Protopolystoma xenopodis TaxID=117903 RepID=A0A448XSQ0_9PLAT|nr:unnamed protein product [Protopolystoma xenopodis]
MGSPGYCLQAKVELTTDHLGLFVRLVPGRFDGQLVWPFDQEIALTLLDQTEARDDVYRVLKPYHMDSDEKGIWDQPSAVSSQHNSGWGFPRFAELGEIIGFDDGVESRFLRNDRIYVKICLV